MHGACSCWRLHRGLLLVMALGFLSNVVVLRYIWTAQSTLLTARRDMTGTRINLTTRQAGQHNQSWSWFTAQSASFTNAAADGRDVTATDAISTQLASSRVPASWGALLSKHAVPTNRTRVDSRFSGIHGLKHLAGTAFYKSLCGEIDPWNSSHIILNVTFGCQDAFATAGYGTGNFISVFHSLHRIATSTQSIDILLTCPDANDTRDRLILPWMMGWFPYSQKASKTTTAATPCDAGDLGRRWRNIQFDFRRMAIAMVGIPSPHHPSAAWAEEHLWSSSSSAHEDIHPSGTLLQVPDPTRTDRPLYPHAELDEAVLHFRCGDIINLNHPSFGFMKFRSFSRHLSPNVTSIGVVTQPFVLNANSRSKDANGTERCRKVISAFTRHLTRHFPKANVTIRNDPNETITLTYARMVMAKQVVIAISSFGVFPAVATFGTAYIRRPDYLSAPNGWLVNSNLTSFMSNVLLIDEPRLMAAQCQQMWKKDGEQVLKWFENYSMPPLGHEVKS